MGLDTLDIPKRVAPCAHAGYDTSYSDLGGFTYQMIRTDSKQHPLPALVAAAGGRAHDAIALVLALDKRLAEVAAGPGEPILRQIRLAWWRDALATDTADAAGEPLIDALRAHGTATPLRVATAAMVDGWEIWALARENPTQTDMADHALTRGAGVFQAIAALCGHHGDDMFLRDAGYLWALWDIAGRMDDPARGHALTIAHERLRGWDRVKVPLPRPLSILTKLALHDLRHGRGAPADFTPGAYFRVLMVQIFG